VSQDRKVAGYVQEKREERQKKCYGHDTHRGNKNTVELLNDDFHSLTLYQEL